MHIYTYTHTHMDGNRGIGATTTPMGVKSKALILHNVKPNQPTAHVTSDVSCATTIVEECTVCAKQLQTTVANQVKYF